jgi:Flp pilus assembly protein CpaB
MAKTILQNVLVLGVDSNREREEGKQAMTSSTVTLQVKPDEVEKLTAALTFGDLRLTLRGDGDGSVVKTSGIRPDDLAKDIKDKSSDGPGSDSGTEDPGSGSSAIGKLPSVPDGPAPVLVAPAEPTTATHVMVIFNGRDVVKHKTTVDRKTGQPVDTEVDKAPEVEQPKPKTDKPDTKTEKVDPKTEKTGAEPKGTTAEGK